MDTTDKPTTIKELQSKGGRTVREKYGIKHYSEMGKKSYQTMLKKYGPEYFKERAKKALAGRLNKLKKVLQDNPKETSI